MKITRIPVHACVVLSVVLLAGHVLVFGCDGGSSTTEPMPPCQLPSTPNITFTFVPPIGSFENVRGLVAFSNPSCDAGRFRVALYIHVPGFMRSDFICKPTDVGPLTMIEPDGTWETDYTTGGNDSLATQITAFLVTANFSGPCFTDTLPTVNGETVLASVTANR